MPEPDNTRGNHPPNTSYPAGLKLPACTTDLTQPGAFRLFSSSAVMTQVADDFVVTCLCFWVRRSCLFTWGEGLWVLCLFVWGFLGYCFLVWVLVVVLGGWGFWDSFWFGWLVYLFWAFVSSRWVFWKYLQQLHMQEGTPRDTLRKTFGVFRVVLPVKFKYTLWGSKHT